jgi:hypothetical protein
MNILTEHYEKRGIDSQAAEEKCSKILIIKILNYSITIF